MTHHLDPDRRRPAPPGWRPLGHEKHYGSCGNCGAVVNLVDLTAKTLHEEYHANLNALWMAVHQLSGPGSRTTSGAPGDDASASPGSDHMSGVGEADEVRQYHARGGGAVAERPSPDTTSGEVGRAVEGEAASPDLKRPPTPEQEEPVAVTRSGAGGPNHARPGDTGTPPPDDATVAPADVPPSAGAAQRTGRGSGGPGGSRVGAPAGTLFERAPQQDHGRFTR